MGHLGLNGRSPDGHTIGVNSRYLLWDGQPVLPVMGEFHFSRYPQDEWELELRKMKAGGVQIVATYLFWIHHEEEDGRFDFSGQRDVRRFVTLCGQLGLQVVVRVGPWAHGECRNGGFPDWLLKQKCQVRTNDPAYLDCVHSYWQLVASQLSGLYFQNGGPIIGIQIENELMEGAEHLRTLKQMAIDLGMIAPLYTCTGWGAVKIPRDEILPVFGGYPDGFWERTLEDWPGHFRIHYFFSHVRNDNTIGNDLTQSTSDGEMPDLDRYPYLTCEVGGGMHVSYHRRIRIESGDITALTLKMIGSGSNLQGYYMYHGGSNPRGRLSSMQESQKTGYPNDVPEISYDFQAPLGEFGQVGPAYNGLRVLHQFLHDFGAELAPMPSVLPEKTPENLNDTERVRWAMRSDGQRGFLFINNYQRREALPDHDNVQFVVKLGTREMRIPETPVRIQSGVHCIWPVQMPIEDAIIAYATVQPVARVTIEGVAHLICAEVEGVSPEIVLAGETIENVVAEQGNVMRDGAHVKVEMTTPGTEGWIDITTAQGKPVRILVLKACQAARFWVVKNQNRPLLLLTRATVLDESNELRLIHAVDQPLDVCVYPRPTEFLAGGVAVAKHNQHGSFAHYQIPACRPALKMHWQMVRAAGKVDAVHMGSAGVAEAPDPDAYQKAAVWQIPIPPAALAGVHDLRLSVRYTGDCARAYVGSTLITDQFYNGNDWIIGLKRFAAQIAREGLRLEILPLRGDAPIYLPEEYRPMLARDQQVAELHSVVALPEQITRVVLS